MDDIAGRDKSIQWKIKGISAKITYRIFSKYASTRYLSEGSPEMEFNNKFQQKYSEMLLESHMQIMFKKKTCFVGSKTLNFVIKFLSASCKIERTMNLIRPHIEEILYECVIPIMLVSHSDISLFSLIPADATQNVPDISNNKDVPLTRPDIPEMVAQVEEQAEAAPKRKKDKVATAEKDPQWIDCKHLFK